MRVLVCGGCDYDNQWQMMKELRKLPRSAVLVHGSAPGADRLAADGWKQLGRRCDQYAADFTPDEVLATDIDLVLAFDGGAGSDSLIRAALHAGVPVMNVEMLSIVAQVYGTTSLGMGL